jgi:hypothetical protein
LRYYIKCKLNPNSRDKLANSITSGNLAKGKIFYEGMQSALRTATIDETDTVHFIDLLLFGRRPLSNGNGNTHPQKIF